MTVTTTTTPQTPRTVIPGPQRNGLDTAVQAGAAPDTAVRITAAPDTAVRGTAAPDAAVHGAGVSHADVRDDGWTALVAAVKEEGRYPTPAEAERVTRVVLSALGGHVTGDERVDLARALPAEAGGLIAAQIPATRLLSAPEFVAAVAARIEGATPITARWDVGSVLSVLPELVGEALTDRILAQLPPGYALLFGRAELTTRA